MDKIKSKFSNQSQYMYTNALMTVIHQDLLLQYYYHHNYLVVVITSKDDTLVLTASL